MIKDRRQVYMIRMQTNSHYAHHTASCMIRTDIGQTLSQCQPLWIKTIDTNQS